MAHHLLPSLRILTVVGLLYAYSVVSAAVFRSKKSHSANRRLGADLNKDSFDDALAEVNRIANLIFQRFEFHRWSTFQFFLESSNMPAYAFDLIKYKIAQKVLARNGSYLMIFGGTSVTAGHDNYYNDSYPFVFDRRLTKAFSALGVPLIVHNIAQGANNCRPSDHCYFAMGGDNPDWMSWEQSFNCGRARDVPEFMARYAYWSGAIMYYVASGAFLTDNCAKSTDKMPWTDERWTPEHEGITSKYEISWATAQTYRALQEDWYNDGNSVSRFTNQIFGGLYKGVGPHGYSVWGHSSHLCNNGTGCTAIDVRGDCHERGGPHWMVKETSFYARDEKKRGKNWHPPSGMHLMRGEVLAYNFAHILADMIYMIRNDSQYMNRERILQHYHQKWQELRVPIPENPLHTKSEEAKVLPICYTNFRPHFNPEKLLQTIVIGNLTGWRYFDHVNWGGEAIYGYKDERPYFESHGGGHEIHLRVGGLRQGTVRICGYYRKDALVHAHYYLDANYPFPANVKNADIVYQPTPNRVQWNNTEFVNDDCFRLHSLPNGGDHVLSIVTNPSHPKHMTALSHLFMNLSETAAFKMAAPSSLSRPEQSQYMMLSDIRPEDIEEGVVASFDSDGVVDDEELLNFIRKHTNTTEGYADFYFDVLQDIFLNQNLSTTRLCVENPVTGRFQTVQQLSSLRDMQKMQDQAQTDEDDKQLEDVPLIPRITPNEELDHSTKLISLPPRPKSSVKRPAEDVEIERGEEWATIIMEYRNFAFVKRLTFLLFQGLLAGFCTVTIFFRSISTSNSAFLSTYQPYAQEIRRYMYILTTLALVGAVDQVLTSWSQITSPNPLQDSSISSTFAVKLEDYQKTSIFAGFFIIILLAISFLSGIIIAPVDQLIYLQGGYASDGSGWVNKALSDPEFTSQFDRWQTFNSIRTATALLAWIWFVFLLLSFITALVSLPSFAVSSVCVLLWRDISRFAKLWIYLRRVRKTAVQWMKRAKALEGSEGLEDLATEELQEIIAAQEIGIQKARMALSLQLEYDTPGNQPIKKVV